jgi:hypothetical protein
MKTLEAIERYGIAIRQIPREIVSMFNFDGDENRIYKGVRGELVEIEIPEGFRGYVRHKHLNNPAYRITDTTVYRRYLRFVIIPENAGYWMSQESGGTSSTMTWNTKKHNLAPTLGESVELCVKCITGE